MKRNGKKCNENGVMNEALLRGITEWSTKLNCVKWLCVCVRL